MIWRGRIIPARAGFTSIPFVLIFTEGDHPRSRGVYRHTYYLSAVRNGSSPLARGLLKTATGSTAEMRIIPARAGFTPLRAGMVLSGAGSSPLARGLRGF